MFTTPPVRRLGVAAIPLIALLAPAALATVNTSTRKQREVTADGLVTFDGAVLVDGANNHPTRPAPFIRTDEERTTRMP